MGTYSFLPVSDARLVQAVRGGDPTAFEVLVARYEGKVRGIALSTGVRAGDVDDVVQQAFLQAFRSLPDLRRPEAFGAWFLRLARNAARRHLERVEPQPSSHLDPVDSRSQESPEGKEFRERLWTEVRQLPEAIRDAILIYYQDGESLREVARALGIKRSAAKMRLKRGRDVLRERLWSELEETLRDLLPATRTRAQRRRELCLLLATATLSSTSGRAGGEEPARALGVGPPLLLVKSAVKCMVAGLLLLAAGLFLAVDPLGWRGEVRVEPDMASPLAPKVIAPGVAAIVEPLVMAPPAAERPAAPYRIEGVVRDTASGLSIHGAVVQVATKARAETDASGRYALESAEPSDFTIVASAEGHVDRSALVHLGDAGTTQLDLDPAMTVAVLVVGQDGVPIPGARVIAAESSFDGDFHLEKARVTGTDGSVDVGGISRVNPQLIGVEKEGYRGQTKSPPADGLGGVTLRFVLGKADATKSWAVTGSILDPQGKPLSGIRVQWKDPSGTRFGPDEEHGKVHALSDALGHYELRFDADNPASTLAVTAGGWAPQIRHGVVAGSPDAPAVADFALEPGNWLRGKVSDEHGAPIQGAIVRAMPFRDVLGQGEAYPGVMREAETDAWGRFLLEDLPGPTAAVSLLGPHGGDWLGRELVTEVNREVEWILERPGVIRGQVVDGGSGRPVRVFTVKQSRDYKVDREESGETFSTNAGEFVLNWSERDTTYNFTVEAPGYAAVRVRDVRPQPRENTESVVIRLSQTNRVEGAVVDGSGTPLSGVRWVFGVPTREDFSWLDWSLEFFLDNLQMGKTDTEGRFAFEDGEAGTLFLQVEGYRRERLAAKERTALLGNGNLLIALSPAESVTGTYLQNGQPAVGMRVGIEYLGPLGAEDLSVPREVYGWVETDPQGQFGWRDLHPGSYLLVAQPVLDRGPESGERFSLFLRKRLTLHPGEAKQVTFGDELGLLSFRARTVDARGNPKNGIGVRLRPAFLWDHVEFEAYSRPDGVVRLLGLRPGRYKVEITQTVKGETEVRALEPLDLSEDTEGSCRRCSPMNGERGGAGVPQVRGSGAAREPPPERPWAPQPRRSASRTGLYIGLYIRTAIPMLCRERTEPACQERATALRRVVVGPPSGHGAIFPGRPQDEG